MRKALFILIASAFALCLIFLPAHAAGKSVWKKEKTVYDKVYSAIYIAGNSKENCIILVLNNRKGLVIASTSTDSKKDRHQRIEIIKNKNGTAQKRVVLNFIKNCGDKGWTFKTTGDEFVDIFKKKYAEKARQLPPHVRKLFFGFYGIK